jgi:hypothetical protein
VVHFLELWTCDGVSFTPPAINGGAQEISYGLPKLFYEIAIIVCKRFETHVGRT